MALSRLYNAVHTEFLLKHISSHEFSAFLHLVLLLGLLVGWLHNIYKNHGGEGSRKRCSGRSLWFRQILLTCFALAVSNFGISCYSSIHWYGKRWNREKLIIFFDLVLRTLSWSAISVYLRGQHPNRVSPAIRIWFGFFLVGSFYSLLLDTHLAIHQKQQTLPLLDVVSDIAYFISALLICFASFLGKNESEGTVVNSLLQETLLSGRNGRCGDDAESERLRGSETVTPYSDAGILSLLTFSWVGSLISDGNEKTLDLADVPQLAPEDAVMVSYPHFTERLDKYCTGGSNVTTLKLIRSLFFIVWDEIFVTALLALVYTLASYVGPYLIDTFVQYLNGNIRFNNEGYALVSAFFTAKIVESLSQRHWFFRLQKIGIRVRAVLVSMIYRKGLTLSCHSKQKHTSGEIINFMAVDAERVGDFSWYLHDPWMVIVQVALALVILYKNLRLASVATLVATVLVMLANAPLGKLQERYQDKLMKSKDTRMKATSEILRNMRILKLQAWEMKFLSKIVELRKHETGWLRKYVYTSALSSFVFWGAPTFISVVTFMACMFMRIPLESGKILSALATFRILQEPIYNLPDTISMIVQTKVSLDRISSFLQLEDLPPDAIGLLPECSNTVIEIKDGNFSWDASSPTLTGINLDVQKGMRIAVCGSVGSGKSSLVSCILGELPKVSGTIRLVGRKAYVAQSPWIQSGTIENNVLFGMPMDREKYENVLNACSLKKDLDILPFGDQTVIGERGINLSGGQKQRIQIARAVYQDADVYLFDDPFSALDAHTGTHVFKETLLGLLSSKTVIYVTHQVEFLPPADMVLVMNEGRIVQCGRYHEILASGSEFTELVGAHKKALSSIGVTVGASKATTGDVPPDDEAEPGPGPGQLVQEEEREKGKVGFSVYWNYITTAYGGALVPFILAAHVVFQCLQIASNYWMAWASSSSSTTTDEQAEYPVSSSVLLTVYISLAVGSSLCILIRSLLLVTAGYKTATLLFNRMHLSIFRAPMSFFDSTPSGRILNRASTDQTAVDTNIPFQIGAVAFSAIQLIGIIAVMSQVAWQVFIVFIPVISISLWYQRYYIPSARELSRLVGVCKAPVIQHFNETIAGSTTIRSFDQETRFEGLGMRLTDDYSRPKFHVAGAMEWLCFRLDMLSSVTFAFSLVFLVTVPQGAVDPGIAGLAVTYGLNLNMLQGWVIWNVCNLENKIISVERMLQYADIRSEPPLAVGGNRPDPDDWPRAGDVAVRDLRVRYAPHMPLVLRGITCTFRGGEKTGIVGRTGSGKSTLVQTLFRLIEPASGRILIDGVDISAIGLHDLRSRLGIIPQDPTMFEGTVRTNLDPLEEHTDDRIWQALDMCQLGDEVRKKDGKLDSPVVENGENWSMGQRQLVCLGRVLLKKSRILVLDEATASVDTATDNLIQQTIRRHFADSTVVTIAHRITSVLDSDMVLLLSQGLVEEHDSPASLLQNNSSSFSKLVAEYVVRSNDSGAAL